MRRTNASSPSAPGEQNLPFRQSSDADEGARPAVPVGSKPTGSVPFHPADSSRTVPAGTLITVRLDSALLLSRIHPGDSFKASVVGPIAVNGITLIDRGTAVNGRVESVEAAAGSPGLVRLALIGIVGNQEVLPLETTGLFAKASSSNGALQNGTLQQTSNRASPQAAGFRLVKGRRLTFRLASPLVVPEPVSIADR